MKPGTCGNRAVLTPTDMEPPAAVQQRRRTKEPITINVKSDIILSVSSCMTIIEDLMKYILYQRCQIPVPFDALVREARVQNQAHQEEKAATTPSPQDMVSLQYLNSKSLMAQSFRHKKWKEFNVSKYFTIH